MEVKQKLRRLRVQSNINKYFKLLFKVHRMAQTKINN